VHLRSESMWVWSVGRRKITKLKSNRSANGKTKKGRIPGEGGGPELRKGTQAGRKAVRSENLPHGEIARDIITKKKSYTKGERRGEGSCFH